MSREYAARASPEGSVPVDKNVSRAFGSKFGSSDRVHVGSAAETISETQDVGVTSGHDRKGAEVIDANGNVRPCGYGHRDDGPPDCHPQGFPCLALQAVAKPSSGADAHTNSTVKTFEHSQCSRCAEVAGSCRAASLHDPRAHEQRYVNATRLIVEQTIRAAHRALRVGSWLRGRLADEQDGAVVGGV